MEEIVNRIDDTFLIISVQNKPVLWDTTLHHENQSAKAAAWREIFVLLNEDFEIMEEKKKVEFGKLVIKRWNKIRHTWLKAVNKIKLPQDHHNKLSFLFKIIQKRKQSQGATPNVALPTGRGVKRPHEDDEEEKVSVKKLPRENRDVAIFEGLMPFLDPLDEKQHLRFWSGVLNVLYEITTTQPSSTKQNETRESSPDSVILISSSSSSAPSRSTSRATSPSSSSPPSPTSPPSLSPHSPTSPPSLSPPSPSSTPSSLPLSTSSVVEITTNKESQ